MSVGPLIILALLLGCMAATVPVFMALFFAGLAGLVWGAGIDPQIVAEPPGRHGVPQGAIAIDPALRTFVLQAMVAPVAVTLRTTPE